MHDLLPIVGVLAGVAIVFMVCVAPLWIFFHYRAQSRRDRELQALGPEEQELASRLLALIEKMEARIGTLERILDADDPRWRERRTVNDRV